MMVKLLCDGEGPCDRRPEEGLRIGNVNMGSGGQIDNIDVVLTLACPVRVRPFVQPNACSDVFQLSGRRKSFCRDIPYLCNPVPVLYVIYALVEREPCGKTAHHTASNCVRLSGHGKGSCSWPADVAGKRMEVVDAYGVVLPVDMLVVTYAPEGDNAASPSLSSLNRCIGPEGGNLLNGLHRDIYTPSFSYGLVPEVVSVLRVLNPGDILLPACDMLLKEVIV